ncbi:ankyrin [Desulfurivibrio sp. C05AmB]|jgi:RecJ-like exonuclease|uniref:ankyrin n=1 Tax=Desulfurivibrio sp. C05AmB TaxID=3374371 RepID=UPI00376F1FB0
MSEKNQKICPECKGKKVIPGNCTCNMEWRGTQLLDDQWDDCKCSREEECPICHGTGYVEVEPGSK